MLDILTNLDRNENIYIFATGYELQRRTLKVNDGIRLFDVGMNSLTLVSNYVPS